MLIKPVSSDLLASSSSLASSSEGSLSSQSSHSFSTQDSIAPAKQSAFLTSVNEHSTAVEPASNTGVWKWLKSWFTSGNSSPIDDKLVAASNENARKKMAAELLEMQSDLEKYNDAYAQAMKEDNSTKAGMILEKILVLLLKAQLKNKEEYGVLNVSRAKAFQDNKKIFAAEQQKINEESEGARKTSTRVGYANTAASVVAGVVTVSAAVLAATNPLTAGLIPFILTTSAGLAKGLTMLLDGYYQGKGNALQKRSYLNQAQKDLASQGVHATLKDIERSSQEISVMWSHLKDTIDREREASGSMFS